jgi:hypothetical protein
LDHKDTDKLNNALKNLRPADNSTNQQNQRRGHQDSSTRLLGVYAHQGKWDARITVHGVRHYLGAFDTPELAHAAYVVAKRELHPGGTL